MNPTLSLLPNFSRNEYETVRLCLPGLDRGGAVWFEAKIDLPIEDVKKLIPLIIDQLKNKPLIVSDSLSMSAQ